MTGWQTSPPKTKKKGQWMSRISYILCNTFFISNNKELKLPEFKFSSLQYFIDDLEDLFKENSTPPADSSSDA